MNKPTSIGGQVCIEFDIEAQLLETDDKMKAQLIKLSDAILKHSNGSGTNQNITATLLPINLGNYFISMFLLFVSTQCTVNIFTIGPVIFFYIVIILEHFTIQFRF